MPKAARSHDHTHLMRRWKAVCGQAGLRLAECARADGFPCHEIVSPAWASHGGIYISAGIHGDEPASTEGLITWAEENRDRLAEWPLLIYPCLNPWGLVNNSRTDARGRDLNRVWDKPPTGLVKAVVRRIAGCRFALALTLHEDYDGQGLYIYEPGTRRRASSWGGALLRAASGVIPPDPRRTIDGRRATDGLIRPRASRKTFTTSLPEAVYLHHNHAERTFTFETPSEFDIDQRVTAQRLLIAESLRLLGLGVP